MPHPISSIEAHFNTIEDPRRVDSRTRHKFIDMIVIAICAVIGGADGWVAIEAFGKSKLDWFRTFLQLPNGIPSHDTFSRLFAAIGSQSFESCFFNWVACVSQITKGEVIAIDGKQLRGSYDKANDSDAIHLGRNGHRRKILHLGKSKWMINPTKSLPLPSCLTS